MDISIFLLIGLGISGLLALRPNLDVLFLTCIYWFVLVLWSLDLIHPFSFNTIHWVGLFKINFSYHMDGLTRLFSLLVGGIGILVFSYAYSYTNNTPDKRAKLFSLLQIFAVSMLGIVLANDMILLFLCWELTTLTSYLLIQFDTSDNFANQAAFNSLFISVLGSLVLLIGFILLNHLSGSWALMQTIKQTDLPENSPQLIIAFCLVLCGVITKSAQFPFYFWLTGAMKAPTPVSAYLHSATMVNAGIYLLARLHPLFGQLSLWYPLLACFGLITMFISSILSLFQQDLKALLAYTTIFALGVMVYLLGGNHPLIIEAFAIFFLFHGIYKAAAFMLVGIIDKEYQTRDLNKLRGIGKHRPILVIIAIIILASMAGLPPFFGFTVKEMIFEAKLASPSVSYFLIGISFLSAMFIAAASLRCIWMFFGSQISAMIKAKKVRFGLICPAILAGVILILNSLEKNLQSLVEPTIQAVIPMTTATYLSPNIEASYLLSLTTVIGGGIIWGLYMLIKKSITQWPHLLNLRILFENSLNYFLLFGKKLTYFTQEQPLTNQLKILFSANLIFLLLSFITIPWYKLIIPINFLVPFKSFISYCLLALSSLSLLVSRKFLYNLISLSIIGLVVSFIFMIQGAVDLAMAQLLIEILTVIILSMALRDFDLNLYEKKQPIHFFNVSISLVIGSIVALMLLLLKTIPFNKQLQTYYIKNSLLLAQGRNVVNVILVDFRSLDTFGEVMVIIATAIGVSLFIRKYLAPIRR